MASYNVENFSTKTDDAKVTKLAEAIVSNMKTPDIIGLTEVQDNDGATDSGTTDAIASAKVLIEKIKSLGGPNMFILISHQKIKKMAVHLEVISVSASFITLNE